MTYAQLYVIIVLSYKGGGTTVKDVLPVYKLKDMITNEIVGIQYKNSKVNQQVALTIDKATELGLSAKVDKFLDLPVLEIVCHNKSYGIIEYSLCYSPIDAEEEYITKQDKTIIHGYMFDKCRVLPLDSEYAIKIVFQ